jgi:hypothetical protein
MKTPDLSFTFSHDWCEFGFHIWLSIQLRRHVISDDMQRVGRYASCGILFLWWRLSLSWLFSLKPFPNT